MARIWPVLGSKETKAALLASNSFWLCSAQALIASSANFLFVQIQGGVDFIAALFNVPFAVFFRQ